MSISSELYQALRSLKRKQLTTWLAIGMLALGIGLNTASFSLLHAVLLRPLDLPDSERLMSIRLSIEGAGDVLTGIAPGTFLEIQERSRSFDRLAAWGPSSLFFEAADKSFELPILVVSAGFARAFAPKILLGRTYLQEELSNGLDTPGGVVLISKDLWSQQFGQDPGVIGRPIRLNGTDFPIVGVFKKPPPEFFGAERDVLLPMDLSRARRFMGSSDWSVYAWLAPGVTQAQAQQELDGLAAGLAERFPSQHKGTGFRVLSVLDSIVTTEERTLLALLQAASLLVLVICSVNLANLLVLRLSFSSRDLALRSALGAGAGRLTRMLLWQVGILVASGTVLGLALSFPVRELLVQWIPETLPRTPGSGLHPSILASTLLSGVFLIFACGWIPVLRLRRLDVSNGLREGATLFASGGKSRFRSGLVALQLGLAVLLLTASGLLLRTFHHLYRAEIGFNPESLIIARLSLPRFLYPDPESRTPAWERLTSEAGSLPGVSKVGFSFLEPLRTGGLFRDYEIVGQEVIYLQKASVNAANPGWRESLGLPLLAGRDFTADDHAQAPDVVMVNEAFARKHFSGRSAIAKQIKVSTIPMEIVGVVANVRNAGLAQEPRLEIIRPISQFPQRTGWLALRTNQSQRGMIPILREFLNTLEPTLQVESIGPAENWQERFLAAPRSLMLLFTFFASFALALAAIGMFVVVASSVRARTREIGIRQALGASRRQIMVWVFRQGVAVGSVGLAIGLLSALASTQLLSAFLVGVHRSDPLSLASAAGSLVIAVCLACWWPAYQASRVNPIHVLRED